MSFIIDLIFYLKILHFSQMIGFVFWMKESVWPVRSRANRAGCRRTIHRFIVLHRRLSDEKTSGRRVPSPISHYARKLVPARTYDVSLPAARAAAVKSRITAAVWNRGCPLQSAFVSLRFSRAVSLRFILHIPTPFNAHTYLDSFGLWRVNILFADEIENVWKVKRN